MSELNSDFTSEFVLARRVEKSLYFVLVALQRPSVQLAQETLKPEYFMKFSKCSELDFDHTWRLAEGRRAVWYLLFSNVSLL